MSNEIEISRRVEIVKTMLVEFYKNRDIYRYAQEESWGVEKRQVDIYISRAKQELSEEVDKPALKGIIHDALADLYRKNADIEDFKECRAILESYAKLFGLNDPVKIEQTNIEIPFTQQEIEERRKMLDL
jgi:hypothetical protein